MITTNFEEIVKRFLAQKCTKEAKIIRISNALLSVDEQIKTPELTDEAKDPFNYVGSGGYYKSGNPYESVKTTLHGKFMFELSEHYIPYWLVPFDGDRTPEERDKLTEKVFRKHYKTGKIVDAPKPQGGHYWGNRPVLRTALKSYLGMDLSNWYHTYKFIGSTIFKTYEGDVYKIVDLEEGEKEFDILQFIKTEKNA